jgi:tRNA dimethylallyltransferase
MSVDFHECWFLTGPTAAGKTAIGLELAERLNAEIISLDSMSIYREMDIGTAKPTADEQTRVPHHLIDICDPVVEFSVSQYGAAAEQAVETIRSRGRDVLFVGGTPLYLKSLLRGMFEGPPADWDFRNEVMREVEQVGTRALHERLRMVDPLAAAKLHPNDVRRIVRALEVHKATGQPISHLQEQFDEGRSADECKVFVLGHPRAVLHQRIDDRVERMIADGWVDEVRGLLERHGELSRTASQAVGYRELIGHLVGKRPLDETVQSIKARTHQFARRQETWFRGLCECRAIELANGDTPASIAEHILSTQAR